MTLEQMLARQQAIVDAARAENQRGLTTEEQTEFDQLQSQIDSIRAANPTPPAPPIPAPADNQRTIEDERQRTLEITTLCREFGLEADEHIKAGDSVDHVRKMILEKQIKDRSPQPSGIYLGKDERDKFRDAVADGLALRVGMSVEKPNEGAEQLRNLSLREIAKETLRIEGVNNAYRLSDDELLRQHLTPTSLLPISLTKRRVLFSRKRTLTHKRRINTGHVVVL